ncbi:MAG: YlmC/YmxH family sporulation protein [Bacilli bacterium]|nr:YlmC/YmxH family sporulation protein [Bacilli bacterium]MDD3895410.1 YlmC/YmxH family sporulation protein [Bacilli bacterium]MDD4407621.1 YlmC/YmxH family sporulation protein [Bacilli bacterium]
MLMSDLQRKDIVNIINGVRLGKIVDIDVTKEGYINSLIVEPVKLMRKISYGNEVNITFSQIVTIGSDVILVDLSIK